MDSQTIHFLHHEKSESLHNGNGYSNGNGNGDTSLIEYVNGFSILIGRHLLRADGLTQKMKDDNDPGERRDRQHDGRSQGQHREKAEDFQSQSHLLRLGLAAGELQGNGRRILRPEKQERTKDERQATEENPA